MSWQSYIISAVCPIGFLAAFYNKNESVEIVIDLKEYEFYCSFLAICQMNSI